MSNKANSYRLVAIETHPIQYKAPLFRRLAQEPGLDFRVVYAMLPDADQQGAGFGVPFAWDVPLLEGYPYTVLNNVARNPGVTRFKGCDTPELYDFLRREAPDSVLVNGWVVKTCLQALWACRRLGIPCMVRGEANLLRPRAWWKHVLHRLLLGHYQAYLAIGTANRDFYRFHHCPENRIFPAPYAVDNAWFSAAAGKLANERRRLREEFGIPLDAVVFLFAGKLEGKKNPLDLLNACAALRQPHNAFLLMAGDGPLRRECEAFTAAHHLPVRFTGFLNQSALPDAYAAADVLALPSDAGETWGLVVNEAMASGRPAIVSRAAGCCRDLVVEGQSGYAFDLHDVSGLTMLMDRYLKNPEQAIRQGENAARHIQNYSIPVAAHGIMAAFHQILGPPVEDTPCCC